MPATSSAHTDPAPQSPPHQPVALTCTLERTGGSPIAAETIDLGTTGMRLTSERPLALDETLAFELPVRGGERIRGDARVVCQERPDVYALRFRRLTKPMATCLREVVTELAAQR